MATVRSPPWRRRGGRGRRAARRAARAAGGGVGAGGGVVGGAKVPSDVFHHAQYNVAVGNQPHSEVAALALFMEGWFGQGGTERHFPDARLVIEPSARGKSVLDKAQEKENEQ